MPVHAHTTRRSHSHRTRRQRATPPFDATALRNHRLPGALASAAQADKAAPREQAKVKPWQVALGLLALLCSGIDLG
ncbi:hypothetical protein [Algiphilus sp.]|uniref:hypothetical protein n=1 Tax=Algiphilus sp. TaxID=1872431 RepID=UPI003B51DFAC